MAQLKLTRNQLAAFLPDNETVRQFETLINTVGNIDTTEAEQSAIAAGLADTKAQQALDTLDRQANEIALAALSPAIQNNNFIKTDSLVVTTSAGLGYGVGSGGAVTQITSRTTGVTLNAINGAITMFSAAGSATAATFTVTNSTVAATDVVHVSVKTATNLYLMFVTATAAGSFNITFQTTGGVATDAPVINFAVIKAVTA
jgi:hypothetical protein